MMQAIILAAGSSTRTYPLTLTRPKPLLKVGKKILLEHNLDSLQGLVDEAILVVGYRSNMIKKYLGKRYKKIKLTYVEQKEQLGTGHALLTTEKKVKGSFFMLAGDDIYNKEDMKRCNKFDHSILASYVKDPRNFGVIVQNKGILSKFVEKPKKFVSNIANTSFYKLDRCIFSYLKKIKRSPRGELELPDALISLSEIHDVNVVKTRNWNPVGFPWDLLSVDKKFRKNKNIMGKNSKIKGKVSNSNIGSNCKIFGKVKNSIIMDGSRVSSDSVVENSVIGHDVDFDGLALSGNQVFSMVKGKKVKIKNLGSVIGDGAKIKSAYLSPGVKVWPKKKVSGVIKKDVN